MVVPRIVLQIQDSKQLRFFHGVKASDRAASQLAAEPAVPGTNELDLVVSSASERRQADRSLCETPAEIAIEVIFNRATTMPRDVFCQTVAEPIAANSEFRDQQRSACQVFGNGSIGFSMERDFRWHS